jgi:hypothetical protein
MGVFSDEHAVESLPPPTQVTVTEEGPSLDAPYTPPSTMMALSTSQPGSEPQGNRAEQDLSIDGRFSERESSLIERGTLEMSLHFKVLLTLAGVLIYWFSLWDLCWNLPREAVIEATYESRDDDVEDAEAYSRRHVSPRVEVYLMLIGVLYCLVSALVLILTGGLYSFINKDTEETHTVTISLSPP